MRERESGASPIAVCLHVCPLFCFWLFVYWRNSSLASSPFFIIYFDYSSHLKEYFIQLSSVYHTGHSTQPYFLVPCTSILTVRKPFMFQRTKWGNHLPVGIRSPPSLNCFYQTLSRVLKHLAHAFIDSVTISHLSKWLLYVFIVPLFYCLNFICPALYCFLSLDCADLCYDVYNDSSL